jgi:hypothetical protein
VKICPTCGSAEQESARFCGTCGALLEGDVPARTSEAEVGGDGTAAEEAGAGVDLDAPTVSTRTPVWPTTAAVGAAASEEATADPTASGRFAASRSRRGRWVLITALVVCVVGGAAATLFATGTLPPKHHASTLSDAAFWQAVNGRAAQGLAGADGTAQADLARTLGTSATRLDGDGATIVAYASEAMSQLRSLSTLSPTQTADLGLLERFVAANRRYGAELQRYAAQASSSAQLKATAATAAAADRVARSALPKATRLPALVVFTMTSLSRRQPHTTIPPASSLTPCDQNISVNSVTSCPFAQSVFRGYVRSYRAGGKQSDVQVEAFSPVTHRRYSMDCFITGEQAVDCTGGRKAFVTFPFSAVVGY